MRNVALSVFAVLAVATTSIAAQDFDQVEIGVTQVNQSLYMLQGSGGNIAVSAGEDGVFMVDDQYAPLTDKILRAIAGFTDDAVEFVINTHWHFDHSDGNENLGGAGAVIVSHANSRTRMETDQFVALFNREQTAYSNEGLPKITFDESVRFHLNGDRIDVFHLGRAHTDGDAMVYFRDSNVIHTGDVFVRYGFPFIDQPNGGSINGMIDVTNQLVALTDDETVFIPGHGTLSDRGDLVEFREMLITIRSRVARQIAMGRTFEETVESGPAAGYPARGIPAVQFLRLVYDSLVEESR